MPPAADPTLLDSLINALASAAGEIGIFAIAATFITILARSYIRHFFTAKRQESQNERGKELQEYQNELDRKLQNHQHEIEKERLMFSDLHDRRAEAIEELFRLLTGLDEDVRKMADVNISWGDTTREEKIDKVENSYEEFRIFYRQHKIYFPPDVCESIEALRSEYRDIYHEFSIRRLHEPGESIADDQVAEWREVWERFATGRVDDLRMELENHFRDLFGVETDRWSDRKSGSGSDSGESDTPNRDGQLDAEQN